MKTIKSAIVGMKFNPGSFAAIFANEPGSLVDLVREPDNEFDPNAIAVHVDGVKSGFVPSAQAALLAADIDGGKEVTAYLTGHTLEIHIDKGDEK